MSLQQERRPQDRREEVTATPTQRDSATATPIQRENGPMMSGRNQLSSYQPTGWVLKTKEIKKEKKEKKNEK